MHRRLYDSFYVRMDATGAKYLDPDIKGKAGSGTIRGCCGDDTAPHVLYDFQVNGTRAGPASFLKGYSNHVICDANTVNHGLFLPDGDTPAMVPGTEVGCWSHCRSNFFDAKKYAQPEALEILAMIGDLPSRRMVLPRRKASRSR